MDNVTKMDQLTSLDKQDQRMPALFVGHGSPMNALEDNAYTHASVRMAEELPFMPSAILVISAHWMTFGSRVLTVDKAPDDL